MVDILVVEDDPVSRTILLKQLEAEGYRIQVAHNGEEGLRLARDLHPELILTVQMMPGMDGLQLCQAIRSDTNLRLTYFILLTANSGQEARLISLESGIDDYLIKPCDSRELLARVRIGLRIRRLQQENVSLEQRNLTLAMVVTLNHEINNQLAGIMAAAEGLMLTKSPDNPDIRKLNIILHCAGHIRDIIGKLQDIRRISLKPYTSDRPMLDLVQSLKAD